MSTIFVGQMGVTRRNHPRARANAHESNSVFEWRSSRRRMEDTWVRTVLTFMFIASAICWFVPPVLIITIRIRSCVSVSGDIDDRSEGGGDEVRESSKVSPPVVRFQRLDHVHHEALQTHPLGIGTHPGTGASGSRGGRVHR